MTWRHHPEAQRLLAEVAANPPQLHTWRDRRGLQVTRYVGPAATGLKRIRAAYGEQLLAESDRTGDTRAFLLWCSETVTMAIDQAIADLAERAAA